MADPSFINVMISSRVGSRFRDARLGRTATLGEARLALKQALQDETLFGRPLFKVLLPDDPEDQSLGPTRPALEGSLKLVRDADIVLVLYNGEAGWAFPNQTLGICHLEFLEAWNKERPKVGVVRLKPPARKRKPAARAGQEAARDAAFAQDMLVHNVPISAEVDSIEALVEQGTLKVREIAVHLLGLGRREARRAAYSQGAPLDWSRLDFERRKARMEEALGDYFEAEDPGSGVPGLPQGRVRSLDQREPVLFVCHGIPAAMGVATARELVGQPFLKDHRYLELAESRPDQPIGPVHLIACAKSVTEAQAMRQLGFPDATIVKTSFGVYVADHVQMIQMVFLADCHDAAATRGAVGAFFEWLRNTREDHALYRRAAGRRVIVHTILDLQREGP